jgi:hypothetical protein
MAEPWTEVEDIVVRGGGFGRLVYPVITDGKIASFSTKLNLTMCTEEDFDIAASAAASSTSTLTKTLSTGVIVEAAKADRTIDVVTGYRKSAASGSNQDKLTIKCLLTKTIYDWLMLHRSDPVILIKPIGRNAAGDVVGYQYILGLIQGIKGVAKEDMMEVDITVQGGTSYVADTGGTYTAFNTLATGGGNTITPVGYDDAETIKAITSDNWTNILTGETETTAAS